MRQPLERFAAEELVGDLAADTFVRRAIVDVDEAGEQEWPLGDRGGPAVQDGTRDGVQNGAQWRSGATVLLKCSMMPLDLLEPAGVRSIRISRSCSQESKPAPKNSPPRSRCKIGICLANCSSQIADLVDLRAVSQRECPREAAALVDYGEGAEVAAGPGAGEQDVGVQPVANRDPCALGQCSDAQRLGELAGRATLALDVAGRCAAALRHEAASLKRAKLLGASMAEALMLDAAVRRACCGGLHGRWRRRGDGRHGLGGVRDGRLRLHERAAEHEDVARGDHDACDAARGAAGRVEAGNAVFSAEAERGSDLPHDTHSADQNAARLGDMRDAQINVATLPAVAKHERADAEDARALGAALVNTTAR